MRLDDLPSVYKLGEELFTSKDSPLLYRTWDQYEISGFYTADADYCVIAEIDHIVTGFALGAVIIKPRTAWKYGYLVWLGVKKSYQNTDIGTKLFNEIKKRMVSQGVRMMIVDTEAKNSKAIDFFKKQGFRKSRDHIWMTLTVGT